MDATIRPYRDDDREPIIALSLRAWEPVFTSFLSIMGGEIFHRLYGDEWRHEQQREVDHVLDDPETTVWVAERSEVVVGFVSAALRPEENLGEVKMLAVEPDYQNEGLGTELTEVATDWIRQAGLLVALVSTGGDPGHAPARRTYEKAGYTPLPAVHYLKAL